MDIRATRFVTAALLVASMALCAASVFAADDASNTSDQAKAGRITVTERVTIDAAPDEVWSTVRDFDALSLWHPAVEGSDISKGENNKPGAQRHLTLADGGTVDEQLVTWNDKNMRYSYKILRGVLPVSNYRSVIAVEPEGDEKTRLVWKGQFDPGKGASEKKAREAIIGVYQAGLKNVKKMMTGR